MEKSVTSIRIRKFLIDIPVLKPDRSQEKLVASPGHQQPWSELTQHTGPFVPWWRHQMETFSVLLAICAENSPVTGEFHAQRPVTRSFDVFFYLRLNKGLSKQSWGWWFETLSCPLWRHCNGMGNDSNYMCNLGAERWEKIDDILCFIKSIQHDNAENLPNYGIAIYVYINELYKLTGWVVISLPLLTSQIAKFMVPTRGPPGSCRPQMGPMLAPWTLLLWMS